MTQTKTQWIYADKNPKLDRVLGSTNLGSRLFLDGDYTFPSEDTMQPGYIEARNISFNATSRSTVSTSETPAIKTSGSNTTRRRNAPLKQSPIRGGHLGSSCPEPSSSPTTTSIAGPSYPHTLVITDTDTLLLYQPYLIPLANSTEHPTRQNASYGNKTPWSSLQHHQNNTWCPSRALNGGNPFNQ
jgi:hypothetical protein